APDVVLWLCKATQVDAGVDEDLAELRAVLDVLARHRPHGPPTPLVAVVTKVDELQPPVPRAPPYEGDKRQAIDAAVTVLRGHLERVGLGGTAVVPVGAYQ